MYAHAHAARQTWWDQRVSRVDARSASAPESAPARSTTYQIHHVANHMVRCPLLHFTTDADFTYLRNILSAWLAKSGSHLSFRLFTSVYCSVDM